MNARAKPPLPALFRSIAEYTYDWETWVDARGVARWINPAVERITGYTVKACLARAGYPLSLACEEDRPLLARVLADARQGGSGNDVEFRVRRKDGKLRWVAISWQLLRDEHGRTLGYRTSVRDIEQRKQIEAELHVMRRRAEAAAAARTQLLANVSHELRSPVHCIAGFTELLLEGKLDAQQRRYLELIARECGGMVRHVEDLLQLAAIEAGGARLSPRPFELGDLVQGVVDAARPVAKARGLGLKLSRPKGAHWLQGDPLRIGQVLRNLVDNALKFTSRGEVRVAVSIAQGRDPCAVTLRVTDTGCGIEPDDVQRLLAPFERANASSQGVGLGLSIVQRLVAAMDGTLHIESAPGRGTKVNVQLPLASGEPPRRTPLASGEPPRQPPKAGTRKADASRAGTSNAGSSKGGTSRAGTSKASDLGRSTARTTASLHGGTALVVDDSAPARELLSALLTREGYRVIEAASGRDALARFVATPCELVFVDYQMPDVDGIETAMSLRKAASASPPERKLHIYLLTANVFARGQAEGRAAIDGILEKPLGRAQLTALLAQLASQVPAPRTTKPSAHARGARDDLELDLAGATDLDARVIADLLEVPGRDGTLFEQLLRSTRAAMATELHDLRARAQTRVPGSIASSAHRIAGLAAVIGARGVADQARALEDAGTATKRTLASLAAAWAQAERALLRIGSCAPNRLPPSTPHALAKPPTARKKTSAKRKPRA